MEEDIKIAENFIEGIKECGLSDCACDKKTSCQAIENLLKAYKEAENQLDLDYVDNNYITKSKVKEIIEELKTEFYKLDEQIDIRKENRNMQDYWEDKEKITTMQTISWCQGKLENLLKE